jgi:hypothetical protein
MKTGEGGMTRSLSGGVLAGTDEPLMFGLAFPTGYLEQRNLWGCRLAGKCLESRLYLFAGLGGVVRPPHRFLCSEGLVERL